MSGNSSIAGMAGVCVLLIVALGHWFLRWLSASIKTGGTSPRTWRLRWTLSGFAALLCLFLIGMAAGGIVHQIGWIIAAPEPLMEPKRNRYYRVAHQHQQQLVQSGFETYLSRRTAQNRKIKEFSGWINATSFTEEFHLFAIAGADDPKELAGFIIFPRERVANNQWKGLVQQDEYEPFTITSEEQLREHLKTFRDRLKPL